MYCKYCGKEIADDSKFCKHCGIQVDESNEVQEVVETTFKGDATPKAEVVVSTKEEAPVKIGIASRPTIKNKTAANEVVVNLKMAGLAICVIVTYFIGFNVYHANDKKPLDENGYFGESCYDGIMSGSWEFSWQRKYYYKVDATRPYSQWSSMKKEMGFPDMEYNGYGLAMSMNLDPDVALERANEMAKRKGLPDSVIENLQKKAKEEAVSDRQSFNEEVSTIRRCNFESDLKENMKWCAIISFAFFILGRYIIKFGKWVANNKTE